MPPPAPPPQRKRLTYAEVGEMVWSAEWDVTPTGGVKTASPELIRAAAAFATLAAVNRVQKGLADLTRVVGKMCDVLADAAKPPPVPLSPPTKAQREEACMRRALTAYIKAGGNPVGDMVNVADRPDPATAVCDLQPRPSTRLRRAMRGLGVVTVGDLCRKSWEDFICTRGCGETTWVELRELLQKYQLRLTDGDDYR